MRKNAFERFTELGFPTSREEDWKFTNLAPLTRAAFDLAGPADSALAEDLPGDAPRLVFVNGHFAPSVSTPGAMLENLREAQPAMLDRHLARHADYRKRSFVALNTAFLNDGAVVRVPARVIVERPVYLIHVFHISPAPRRAFSNPRNLIVVEEGAHASIVECYLGERQYFSNAVTEIVAGEGADGRSL